MINSILLQVINTTVDTLMQNGVNDLPVSQTAQTGTESLSFLDLALKGGPIMIPIAILSILAIYIFIERFIAINRASHEDNNFMNNIRDFIHSGRIDSALALCKGNASPIARMIEKGITRIGKPLNDINTAIENVGKIEVAKLEKNVTTLAVCSGAAPMLGFLGTVSGMVRAFYNMSKAGNNIDIATLSGGIYEAMVTTVAGLIVGIIGYFCYNIIVARISKLVSIMEARATEFIDLLHEPAP
jgi:biopolymer transport protein ExbB